jgi:hypothetical protein
MITLQKQSHTQSTPSLSAKVEVIKRLSAIESHLSAPSTTLVSASSYAEKAFFDMPQSSQDKPVHGRALRAVTVKVLGKQN